ncbi:MAG: radical SAM protein [Euryarchaeota archaeon]|nr:radical SAM protein [Euryarchaeota archaeon]
MQKTKFNNYDIQVDLETGKINYSNLKENTKISFFGTFSDIKTENTSYFSSQDNQTFDLEYLLSSLCSLELNISQLCNMNCKYCFANSGTYGNAGMMSFETAKIAIDLLYGKTNNNHISIKFFGGEPLLNFTLIREIVEYIRSQYNGYNTDFEIATNGTIISEEILKLIKENSFNVQVSLDGDQCSHDKHRTFLDGTPTYEKIVSNIKKMKEAGIKPQIRTTFSHQNMDMKKFLLYYTNDLGLQVNFSPVMSKDSNLLLTEKDLIAIYQVYLEIFEDAVASDKYKGVLLNRVLRDMVLYCFETENPSLLTSKSYFCGAGLRMLSVDISGNIYPCHGFIGNDQFNFGNVYTCLDKSKLKHFLDRIHIANKSKCLSCVARNFCGGGCSHFFNETNDNVSLPHEGFCGFVKVLYKLAIIFYVNMKEKGISKEIVKSPLLTELNDILLDNDKLWI